MNDKINNDGKEAGKENKRFGYYAASVESFGRHGPTPRPGSDLTLELMRDSTNMMPAEMMAPAGDEEVGCTRVSMAKMSEVQLGRNATRAERELLEDAQRKDTVAITFSFEGYHANTEGARLQPKSPMLRGVIITTQEDARIFLGNIGQRPESFYDTVKGINKGKPLTKGNDLAADIRPGNCIEIVPNPACGFDVPSGMQSKPFEKANYDPNRT